MSREAWISAIVMGALIWSIGTVSLLSIRAIVMMPTDVIELP